MKLRLERILELLLSSNSYVSIQDLALHLNTGERTIFRDIGELSYNLSKYDVVIEKKHGSGIRLGGNVENLCRRRGGIKSYLADLTPLKRQYAEIVYLCNIRRTVKLGELANLLQVSDSCVSADLHDASRSIMKDGVFARLSLECRRGIGAEISGSEWYLRMSALSGIIAIIPAEELGRALINNTENAELKQLQIALGFTAGYDRIMSIIRRAEQETDSYYSLFDFSLFYLYMCMTLSHPEGTDDTAVFPIEPAVSEKAAADILAPEQIDRPEEIFRLRCFLSALEPAQLSGQGYIHADIAPLVDHLETELLENRNIHAPFETGLRNLLCSILSSVIYKKMYGIPCSERDYSAGVPVRQTGMAIRQILSLLVKNRYGVELMLRDIEPFRVLIKAADAVRPPGNRRVRVAVSCFEGICLAQLIASVLRQYFQDIAVVDIVGAVALTSGYLENRHIDLLVSTMEINDAGIPCFFVRPPFSEETFRSEFASYLSRMPVPGTDSSEAPDTDGGFAEKISPEKAESIFSSFKVTELQRPVKERKITAYIAMLLLDEKASRQKLKNDFDRREEGGSVYLEMHNIRLFHCRSSVVSKPVAGLIRSCRPVTTVLYLVAPEKATHDELSALSLITSALIERPDFAETLRKETDAEIRRQLFSLIP